MGTFYHHRMKSALEDYFGDRYFQMVVLKQTSSEKISTWYCKGRANQQKVFRILNTIIRRAHRIYGIPKGVLEFVKVQFPETNPELSEI